MSVHSYPSQQEIIMKIKTKVRGGGSNRCGAPKIAIP
jgi:hypothetical protein